ncbi:hypothetical protein LNQ49_07415 [Flavobacterium sp. F-65]|jgi:hypothetical protein|uniref:DUF4369 domain-containing protein n=1 Tax=Flavobacterium pisciphilum TaxID=2893755 RepID=A0ABS8MRN0_9FLAO|nr:hypothetical protein [Flavobacterium sp. F-65]MCC9071419.1 hypothetical protein [Flavobacterium sp. F-65]
MKKQILINLVLLISSIFTINAQIVDTGDKVGIGTASPTYKLDIQGAGMNAGIHLSKTDGVTSSWYLHPGRLGNGEFSIGDDMLYRLVINNQGNIGIGTISPSYKLDVVGTIRAREIKVDLNGADFVFEETYKLMPLSELEKFVKNKKHLPEIQSANEMEENGTDLGVLTSKLLQKIEELTLYTIDQNKKIIELEKQNETIDELKQILKLQNEKIEKIKSNLK